MTVPDITRLARVLTDPGRAAMLQALMDGQSYPATDLARIAHVTPQTASSHLRRLLDAELVTMEPWGRHRYYRIANERVASMLESFAVAAPGRAPRNVVESEQTKALRHARTCYDHLAGRLGVAVTDALEKRKYLAAVEDRDYDVTPHGAKFFARFGIDVDDLPRRRAVARRCLDWSERRPHLAGALASSFTSMCFERGWIARMRRSRAIVLTPAGKRAFARELDVELT